MLQFDYESILNRLKSNLQTLMGDAGITGYSSSQKILESVAEELQRDALYTEYLTRESKWSLCQNTSSIMTALSMFGYKVHRKVGSKGTLSVKAVVKSGSTSGGGGTVIVRNFDQFSNGTLKFCVFSSTSNSGRTLSVGASDYTSVPIVQGSAVTYTEVVTVTDDSDLPNYAIHIDDDSIEDTAYSVLVNDVYWKETDSLAGYDGSGNGSLDTMYMLKNDSDFGGVIITFGDGVSSASVSMGDVIKIKYVRTDGADGNVYDTANVTKMVSVADLEGRTGIDIVCTNEDEITGGDDYEDVDSIREKAPKTFMSGTDVVTVDDYQTYVSTLVPSSLVSVWGWEQEQSDSGLPFSNYTESFHDTSYTIDTEGVLYGSNLVKVSGLTYDTTSNYATPFTNTMREKVATSLQSVKPVTDVVWFDDPLITYFKIRVRAFYDTSLYNDSSVVSAEVNDCLKNAYAFGIPVADRLSERKTMTFMNNLYYSEYYALIHDLGSVAYHQADIRMYQIHGFSGVTVGASSTEYGFSDLYTHHMNLRKGRIYMYVKENVSGSDRNVWSLVAVDNCDATSGYGKFVALSSSVKNSLIANGYIDEATADSSLALYGNFTITTHDISGEWYIDYVNGGFKSGINASQTDTNIYLGISWSGNENYTNADYTDYQVKLEFVTENENPDIVMTKRNQIMAVDPSLIDVITYPIGYVPDETTEGKLWTGSWDGHEYPTA